MPSAMHQFYLDQILSNAAERLLLVHADYDRLISLGITSQSISVRTMMDQWKEMTNTDRLKHQQGIYY